MSQSVMIYVYTVFVGLVAGGIAVSAYRALTNELPSFQSRPETPIGALGQVLVVVFGGPLVLMRNAVRGRLIEHRPLPFLAASAVVASLWCFFSGAFLVNIIEKLA